MMSDKHIRGILILFVIKDISKSTRALPTWQMYSVPLLKAILFSGKSAGVSIIFV